jgi:hypothetical protein
MAGVEHAERLVEARARRRMQDQLARHAAMMPAAAQPGAPRGMQERRLCANGECERTDRRGARDL